MYRVIHYLVQRLLFITKLGEGTAGSFRKKEKKYHPLNFIDVIRKHARHFVKNKTYIKHPKEMYKSAIK